jgi:FHS family glucose/mannose:H+ symporter-like MFS transporter
MQKPTSKTVWLLTAGAFFAFFLFGFSDNLKGAVLPALLQDMHFNYALGGTILMGIYAGFMTATLATGFLADAFGQKVVMVLAGITLALGVTGLMTLNSALGLTAAMACLGFGMGSLELGCNALIVSLHREKKGRYLNLMSVMHGMGSKLAPLYAGWMLSGGQSWREVYRWDLVLIAPLTLYFLLVQFPRKLGGESARMNFRQLGATAFSNRMKAFYAAILLYVAIEIGIASWVVEFLQKVQGQSVTRSTQALSIFFGLIMLGRFVGSFFIERFGYLRSILIAGLAASACVALGLFGPPQLAFLLPASGFFLSIIFPTITAAASGNPAENMNTILGLLFTFAGLGGIAGPWLVGIASNLGGIQFGFGLNLVFGLLMVVVVAVLMRIKPEGASAKS